MTRRVDWKMGIVLVMAALIFIAAMLAVRSWAHGVYSPQRQHSASSSIR